MAKTTTLTARQKRTFKRSQSIQEKTPREIMNRQT